MPPKKTRARRKTSSPSLPALASGVGLEFLARYLADREEGREQELSVYLKMFPGADEEVRQEYLAATDPRADEPTAGGVPPGATSPDDRYEAFVVAHSQSPPVWHTLHLTDHVTG